MDRKGGNTAVVTTAQVSTALKTAQATSAEERVLRMRYGAGVDTSAPLPTAHGDNEDLGDELLLIELQLLKAVKAHRAQAAAKAKLSVVKNPAKDKIVRSLKKKA